MNTVTLSGEGAIGLTVGPRMRALVDQLPITVALGRKRPAARPQALRLSSYIVDLKNVPIPEKVDWYSKAAVGLSRMYLNDRYGCCVFSGKAHNLAIWGANDNDSGGEVQATDKEISDQYFSYTGGRDEGAVISEVLDYMRNKGFLAGGKRYYIDGYVSCDWRSKELTQIGLALFGAGSIGFNLPGSWTNQAVWDVTSSGFVGGHDVSPCGYGAKLLGTNADGVVVSSWGRLYLFTWQAWTSSRYIDELYFMLPRDLWTGVDKVAPSKVDFTTLKQDLEKLGSGTLPPLPDPEPVPPVPPVPVPPVVPPVPPIPVPVPITSSGKTGVGSTQPQKIVIQVPTGLWGRLTPIEVTIPALTVPPIDVTVTQNGGR